MSFPINWSSAPDDDLTEPFFPDVSGWTKVISTTAVVVSTPDDGFDFTFAGALTLIPWTNPAEAVANDGINSASNITEYDSSEGGTFNTITECLYASQWGFDIPPGATIQAVLVSINGVIYDIANVGFSPPGPAPNNLFPFALHVDAGWQYLGGVPESYGSLDTIPTGQQFSDGSWDGTPTLVGTDKLNFTDTATTYYPPAAGGLLPFLGVGGNLTLTSAQVNATTFGVGFTLKAQTVG